MSPFSGHSVDAVMPCLEMRSLASGSLPPLTASLTFYVPGSMSQGVKDNVGISSITSDEDLLRAIEKSKDLEAEVRLLKKVLETANKIALKQAPAANAQFVSILFSLGQKVATPATAELYSQYKTVVRQPLAAEARVVGFFCLNQFLSLSLSGFFRAHNSTSTWTSHSLQN